MDNIDELINYLMESKSEIVEEVSDIKQYLKNIDTNITTALTVSIPKDLTIDTDINSIVQYKDSITLLSAKLEELSNILSLNVDIDKPDLSKSINIDGKIDINTDIDAKLKELDNIITNYTPPIIDIDIKPVLSDINLSDLDIEKEVKLDINLDYTKIEKLKTEISSIIEQPEFKIKIGYDLELKALYDKVNDVLSKDILSKDILSKDILSKDLSKNLDIKINPILDLSKLDVPDMDINLKPKIDLPEIDINVKYNPNKDLDNLLNTIKTPQNLDVQVSNINNMILDIQKDLPSLKLRFDKIDLDIKPIIDKSELKIDPIKLDIDLEIDKSALEIKDLNANLNLNVNRSEIDKLINELETTKIDINITRKEAVVTDKTLPDIERSDEISKLLLANNTLLTDVLKELRKGTTPELINKKETNISNIASVENNNNSTTITENKDDSIKQILSEILASNKQLASSIRRNGFKNNTDILTT